MAHQRTEVMLEYLLQRQRPVLVMHLVVQVGVQAAKASLDPVLLHLISMAWAEEVAVTLAAQQQLHLLRCPLDILAGPVAVVEQVISILQILPADQPLLDQAVLILLLCPPQHAEIRATVQIPSVWVQDLVAQATAAIPAMWALYF